MDSDEPDYWVTISSGDVWQRHTHWGNRGCHRNEIHRYSCESISQGWSCSWADTTTQRVSNAPGKMTQGTADHIAMKGGQLMVPLTAQPRKAF